MLVSFRSPARPGGTAGRCEHGKTLRTAVRHRIHEIHSPHRATGIGNPGGRRAADHGMKSTSVTYNAQSSAKGTLRTVSVTKTTMPAIRDVSTSLFKRGVNIRGGGALLPMPGYRDFRCGSGNHLRETPCKLSQAP